ncbi:hypothetical protein [Roseicyclus sp.]|uniref:hypothetical protein n=1 Tax=Roseicyclus sp. TaxID=1914329 RepID=UPI003F9EBC93
MRRRIALAVLAAILSPAHAAGAGDAPAGLVCRVEGYDVALINRGEAPVEAGTSVTWSVPFSRSEGQHHLERPLEPGALVMLNGVLESSYLRPGTECLILRAVQDP